MDNISIDKQKLINGINKVCDAVKITLGAAGANAILEEQLSPFHTITNDGISIAKKIKLEDPVENMGANIMKEVAEKANKESGDGTTTTMVLTQAILEEGVKIQGNPMDIKRSLDECVPIIFKALDDQKKEITPERTKDVALTSSEDVQMAEILQKIYTEIGSNGIVELDNSNTTDTFYEITDGVRLRNTGFIPSLSNLYGKQEVWKNPSILLVKQEITTNTQLEEVYKMMRGNNKNELVLLCDQIDQTALQAIAMLHVNGIFKTLIIKAPVLWKDWIYEDFAAITGATIIEPATGTNIKQVKMSHLGTCDKIIVTRDETRVIGVKDIKEHLVKVDDGSEESKLRISWLETKAAILKIGGNSESELSYKRLKAEDARNSVYQALQSGVVAGGGVALMKIVPQLPSDTIGGKILREALTKPIRQIISNYYGDKEFVQETHVNEDIGFNTKTGQQVNMYEAGIIDPLSVVKNSIKDAISVAGTVLTAKVIITDHETKR